METQLSFVAKLSLEEMALRKSVTLFWSDTDIVSLMEKFQIEGSFHAVYPEMYRTWRREVEDKVRDKISKLNIPEQLKRRMDLVVKPIGLQIPEWRESIKKYLYPADENPDIRHLLKQLCWTSTGRIDYKKTAEKLVTLETLYVQKRFKIASGYCLVDFLPLLWEELPEEYKSRFSTRVSDPEFWSLAIETKLELYWGYFFNSKMNTAPTNRKFNRLLFADSAATGSESATKYFFQKSFSEVRNGSRESFILSVLRKKIEDSAIGPLDFPKEKCSIVSCYLISQLSPESQLRVIRKYPGYLFKHFLQWPWHDLFLDITNLIWNFPPDVGRYADLLRHIQEKVRWSNYYFPKLFQEFFRRSPSDFRKFYVDRECAYEPVFSVFLEYEDEETVKVILRNIDYEDRVRLLSSYGVFEWFRIFILRNNLHLVELCVREVCLEKEDRERLKEVYMGYITQRGNWRIILGYPARTHQHTNDSPVIIERLQFIFESLDKTPASGLNKRRSEDDTETPAKRQHSRRKSI